MGRCEDFPCCGHEMGCCPQTDEDGNVTAMTCVCGAPVAVSSRSSLCRPCLTRPDPDDPYGWDYDGGYDSHDDW